MTYRFTNKRKIKRAFLSMLLVLSLVITGAFALLTAKDSAVNKFTVGNVDIELTEPSWVEADGENIVSGQVIAKDPTITNTGKNNAYVYMMVSVPKADAITVYDETTQKATKVNDLQLFTYDLDRSWTLVDSKMDNDDLYNYYLYAYNAALAPETKTAPAFTSVKFANVAEGQFTEANNKLQVLVDGYAIQSDFYNDEATDAATAWRLYVRQNNWAWPSNPATAHYTLMGFRRSPVKNVRYNSENDVITLPEAISTDFGDKAFAGWCDERGNMYAVGDSATIKSLYIKDKDTGEITNLYPVFKELPTATFGGDGSNLPVKLMPKNDTCNTVIMRGSVSETNATNTDSSGNRLYGEPTTEYPYTYAGSDDWFVWGIEPGTTLQEFVDSYIRVQGDGYAKITTSGGTMIGTGSVVEIYDRRGTDSIDDDTLVEKFTVVVYGDVNGDAEINRNDVNITSDEVLQLTRWSKAGDDYRVYAIKAANIQKDSRINVSDVSLIESHVLNEGVINQITGLLEYN